MDMDAKIAICRTLSCGLEDCVRIPSDNHLQGLMGKDGKRNLVRLLLLLIHVLFFLLFFSAFLSISLLFNCMFLVFSQLGSRDYWRLPPIRLGRNKQLVNVEWSFYGGVFAPGFIPVGLFS